MLSWGGGPGVGAVMGRGLIRRGPRAADPLTGWHAEIGAEFPECDRIVRRFLVTHHHRSRRLARGFGFWFRLFGCVEVVLGVTFPLLFLYPQTQDNSALQATFSVVIAVCTALSTFFGWRENWGTYRGQNVFLSRVLGEWELELITIIHGSGSPGEKKSMALEVTKATLASLFDALNQEHESYFAGIGSALEIRTSLGAGRHEPDEAGGADRTGAPGAPDGSAPVGA